MNSYRATRFLDSEDDSSSDVYDSDDSLEDIYEEIVHLQHVVAAQNAAPRSHAEQIAFPTHEVSLPQVETRAIPSNGNAQVIVLKNLPDANKSSSAPNIDALVIPEEYDLEYDSGGFPYVVPRKTANAVQEPDGTVVVANPQAATCPVHGSGDQGCPVHGGHCLVHPEALPGLSECNYDQGPARMVQFAEQPMVQRVVRKKKKSRKGKTLFEKLIS